MVVRGGNVSMTLNKDYFASMGDILLFGAVMDEFFSRYSSINSYSRFTLLETTSGETFAWKPRTGRQTLK